MTPRLKNKAYDEMYPASGFPKPENPFPFNTLIDYRHFRQTPDHNTTETRWLVKKGPNKAGFYTIVKGTATRHVHERDMRCAMDKDHHRFEQERIAQWVYDPDQFALYVSQLEDIINNPPRAGK